MQVRSSWVEGLEGLIETAVNTGAELSMVTNVSLHWPLPMPSLGVVRTVQISPLLVALEGRTLPVWVVEVEFFNHS